MISKNGTMLDAYILPASLLVSSIIFAKIAFLFYSKKFPYKLFRRRSSASGTLWEIGKWLSVFILALISFVLLLFLPLTIPHPV